MQCLKWVQSFFEILPLLLKILYVTGTTRTPAFWGYPPPPHDYLHYWTMLGPKSKQGRTTLRCRSRSWHATHLLMLVIICAKYGKNPSGTVDATERTRFSRPRPNDLEDIGQGQRSLFATHPLTLVIICAKYGKNPSRTAIYFFKVKAEKFQKFAKISNFKILKKT